MNVVQRHARTHTNGHTHGNRKTNLPDVKNTFQKVIENLPLVLEYTYTRLDMASRP